MKKEINPAVKSKINKTALIMATVGILAGLNVIPEEIEGHVVEVALVAGPALIAIFRTWFTKP